MGFEPTISVGERPQTYALDHAANGTGATSAISQQNILQATSPQKCMCPRKHLRHAVKQTRLRESILSHPVPSYNHHFAVPKDAAYN